LNLTPEQSRAAGEILMRQARMMSAGIQQALSGKFDKAEIIKLATEKGNPDEQIKALLTPEQLAAYPSYKQEEAAGNARLMANNELLQMQSSLGLTAEQEDRVFGVLYQQQLNELNGTAQPAFTNLTQQTEQAPLADDLAKQSAYMQWSLDQKIKALQNDLTPAQLESYRQQQEAQLKQAKDIMNKMAGENGPK
jgi:hypothetical protein